MCLETRGVLLCLEAALTASSVIYTLLGTWRVRAEAGVCSCPLQSQGCILV